MKPAPQIIEIDVERDRKTCIALFKRVTGADKELAQWLLDHPRYSSSVVAEWLECSSKRIRDLREWAKKGFPGDSYRSGPNRHDDDGAGSRSHGSSASLKSQDNLEDIDIGGDGVEEPEQIRKNILDSIERHTAVARAYKKVLKVSSLDQTMKDEVSTAIGRLITTWQSLQRALRPKEKENV